VIDGDTALVPPLFSTAVPGTILCSGISSPSCWSRPLVLAVSGLDNLGQKGTSILAERLYIG